MENMGSEHSAHRRQNRPVLYSFPNLSEDSTTYDENMSLRLRNNYQPLRFHHVHGDNISLINGRTMACRSEGFCKGIVFSDRPVLINERVYVKFLDTSPHWSGALRIGFTMLDPLSMKSKLPRFACPDLTSIHGNWAKAVGEKLVKKGSTLFFYVDQNGDVHYGIEAEEYGIFFGGVNTAGKLWAVLDIYGNTIAVQFVDPYIDRSQIPTVAKVFGQDLQPLSFHFIHGENVTLSNRGTVLCKNDCFHTLAYAFSKEPIPPGTTVVMKVLETDPHYKGSFVFGITSCDPTYISPKSDLPENVFDLLDRPEYWVVKQKAYSYDIGDRIMITIGSQGKVEITVNDETDPAFYVEYTEPLWLFINIDEEISELKLLGTIRRSNSEENLCKSFDKLNIKSSDKKEPGPSGEQTTTECVICYEESVDCALYRCGHMCMCYSCASKLFNSESTAQCPICRNYILDVIKIYK